MKIDIVRKIASIIRNVAPEFKDMNEDDLKFWIELSEPYVSESQYGRLYPQALAYLTAHKMALNAPAESQEGEVNVSVKSTMNVASYTEGSTSISFNNSAVSSGGGGTSGTEAEYLLTAYGLQFLSIRKRCIVPIMVAGMKRT